MPKYAIVADTDCSLPAPVAARLGIQLVPIIIQYGEQSYLTNTDIDDEQLFAMIDRQGQLPKTSAPSPGHFTQAFERALADGAGGVICYCVSSAVSATYNAACVARDAMPDKDITVVDTQALSMTQGFMAMAAAERAAEGDTRDQILAAAAEVGERAKLYASLATLKYLAMSGRVGHLAAGMASILDVKPILTVRDGKLDMLEKVRSRKRAWARVIELIANDLDGQAPEHLAIIHVAAREAADAFQQLLSQRIALPEDVLVCDLTPGLSVHSGSGLVGACFTAPDISSAG